MENGERITIGGKSKGEIRGEFRQVTGMAVDMATQIACEIDIKHLRDGGYELEKWRRCWCLVGLIWSEVWKLIFSTSRKVTWERVMVKVN